MKKFFVVLSLVILSLGFYRGWFALTKSGPDARSHKVNINLAVDPDKVKADAATVKEKSAELTGKATDRVKELGDQAKESK